jgi:hypothetical protein
MPGDPAPNTAMFRVFAEWMQAHAIGMWNALVAPRRMSWAAPCQNGSLRNWRGKTGWSYYGCITETTVMVCKPLQESSWLMISINCCAVLSDLMISVHELLTHCDFIQKYFHP